MTTLRLGTRRSPLAQAQAKAVAATLQRHHPDLHIEIVFIVTTGDKASEGNTPAADPNRKATFTKEIEEALLAGHIDFAVHSLKDVPGELPAGLALCVFPPRESPFDAWVSRTGTPFSQLPSGARIGTSSIRRIAQLRHHRPNLSFVDLRGNVDTRLKKLADGECDGTVLAAAGLKRLGLESRITNVFSSDIMLPAIGQGCLAIEIRQADRKTAGLLTPLDDTASRQTALAERALLNGLGGSCNTPIGGLASVSENRLSLTGIILHPSGNPIYKKTMEAGVGEPAKAGRELAEALLLAGAGKCLL